MRKYIGVKLLAAKALTLAAFIQETGVTPSTKSDLSEDGYLVEYADGGKPNSDKFDGYVAWSPKDVFENAYRPVDGLSFGLAIEALKKGFKVARSGWNGKGMWLCYVHNIRNIPDSGISTSEAAYRITALGIQGNFEGLPWIGMKTADNKFVPWLASQTDVLADDWQIVE